MTRFDKVILTLFAFGVLALASVAAYWNHSDNLSQMGLYQYAVDKTLTAVDKRLLDMELIVVKALKIDTTQPPVQPPTGKTEAAAKGH